MYFSSAYKFTKTARKIFLITSASNQIQTELFNIFIHTIVLPYHYVYPLIFVLLMFNIDLLTHCFNFHGKILVSCFNWHPGRLYINLFICLLVCNLLIRVGLSFNPSLLAIGNPSLFIPAWCLMRVLSLKKSKLFE